MTMKEKLEEILDIAQKQNSTVKKVLLHTEVNSPADDTKWGRLGISFKKNGVESEQAFLLSVNATEEEFNSLKETAKSLV